MFHTFLIFKDIIFSISHTELSFVEFRLVPHPHVLDRVCHHVRQTGGILDAYICGEFHYRGPYSGLLGRYEDHAIRCLGTVDGCRRILEDCYRLYVMRIYLIQGIFHSVYKNHRAGIAQCPHAPYPYCGGITSGFSGSGVDIKPGHGIQGMRSIRQRLVLHLIHLPHCNRACKVDLLLLTISDNHHIIQLLIVLFHGHEQP